MPRSRAVAAQDLEEDDSQAEDVASLIDLTAEAEGLFGAHVGRRADHRSIVGQARIQVRAPGQPEVDQARAAKVVNEHVGWLDVAVEHPLAMRMIDRVCQVAKGPGGRGRIEPMLVPIPVQRPPAHEMEGHPASSVRKPGVVHGHDVGVVEPGGRSSLAEEPLHHPFVGVGLLENLEGHIAIEPGVKRQEDLSETAIPQPFPQLKPPERAERPSAPGFRPVQRRIRGAGLGLEHPLVPLRHPRLGPGVILLAVDLPAAVWAKIARFTC